MVLRYEAHSSWSIHSMGLELWPAPREELLNFRRKINLNMAHDPYEHWRDSNHDDLVLAVAMACWEATARRGQRAHRLIR